MLLGTKGVEALSAQLCPDSGCILYKKRMLQSGSERARGRGTFASHDPSGEATVPLRPRTFVSFK